MMLETRHPTERPQASLEATNIDPIAVSDVIYGAHSDVHVKDFHRLATTTALLEPLEVTWVPEDPC